MDYRIQKKTFYQDSFSPFYLFKKWRKKDEFVKNNWSDDESDFYDLEDKMTPEEAENLKNLVAQVIEERIKNLDMTDTVEKIDINGHNLELDIKFNYKD